MDEDIDLNITTRDAPVVYYSEIHGIGAALQFSNTLIKAQSSKYYLKL